MPLERIGDYVGHAGTYMSEKYHHLVEGQGAKDVAELDALLTGGQRGAHKRLGSDKRPS